MLVTVTTTSSTLLSLVDADGLSAIRAATQDSDNNTVIIQNTGAGAVYVECGADATATDSLKLVADADGKSSLVIEDKNLAVINLIAEANTDVRVLIT